MSLPLFLVCGIMSAIHSQFEPASVHSTSPAKMSPPSPENTCITPEQKERLVLLGTTAGSPGIVFEAIRSGNIMDPAHMLRAEKMKEDWEKGPGVFAPYLERQRRVDQEQEQLRLLGEKMGGPLKELGYKAIRELIGQQPTPPPEGWFLRIQRPERTKLFWANMMVEDSSSNLNAASTHSLDGFQSKLRAKLTQADVVEIFLCKHSHKSPTVVSRLCGVSEKTVRDIWSGRTRSKETQHLDPSRAVLLKKIGRPAGSKDSKPRKPRGKTTIETLEKEGDKSPECDGCLNHGSIAASPGLGTCDLGTSTMSLKSYLRMADRGISIDEQLDEWDQQGCWIDRSGLRRMGCLFWRQ